MTILFIRVIRFTVIIISIRFLRSEKMIVLRTSLKLPSLILSYLLSTYLQSATKAKHDTITISLIALFA